ncbi:hypothetical protein LLG95_11515 [bacterium]|nr:hypothetical protein [bacterium]
MDSMDRMDEMMRKILVLLSCAVLVAGCAGTGARRFVNAQVSAEGDASVTLTQGGMSQVLVQAGPKPSRWDGVLLDNRGTSRIDNVRLWGMGPVDLVQAATGSFSPFGLLPRERFFCRAAAAGTMSSSGLSGTFLWQMPVDPQAIDACIDSLHKGKIEPGRGIVLRPGKGEAWVQLAVNAPFEHDRARLGWQVAPARAVLVMVSLDGRSWGQIGSAASDAWLRPLDLSATIKGSRRFYVRLLAPPSSGEVVIGKLRLERELSAVGQIREWRAGINEVSIAFDAPRGALLEMKLIKAEE